MTCKLDNQGSFTVALGQVLPSIPDGNPHGCEGPLVEVIQAAMGG